MKSVEINTLVRGNEKDIFNSRGHYIKKACAVFASTRSMHKIWHEFIYNSFNKDSKRDFEICWVVLLDQRYGSTAEKFRWKMVYSKR